MPHVTEEHETATAEPTPSTVRDVVWHVVVVVGLFALVGVLAGVVWEWLWTPASGTVVDHTWRPTLDSARGQFSGTAWYVVVASVAGLLTGAGVGLAFHRRELVTLGAVVLGSALAAWVMLKVGYALGPADPQTVAATAADGTAVPAELSVSGKSPYLALPSSALLALVVVFFGVVRRHRTDT
jgi:hypothetical protein